MAGKHESVVMEVDLVAIDKFDTLLTCQGFDCGRIAGIPGICLRHLDLNRLRTRLANQ